MKPPRHLPSLVSRRVGVELRSNIRVASRKALKPSIDTYITEFVSFDLVGDSLVVEGTELVLIRDLDLLLRPGLRVRDVKLRWFENARIHPSVSLLRDASPSTSSPNLPSAPSTRVDAHDTRDASNERNLLDFIHLTPSRALHAVAHPLSVLRSRPDDEAPQGFLASSERSPSRRRRRRPAPSIDVVERQRDRAIDHRVFAFHCASRRRRRPRFNVPSWRAVQRFKR